MNSRVLTVSLGLLATSFLLSTQAQAAPSVTEEFDNAANWVSGAFTAIQEVGSGGVGNSSYVSWEAGFDSLGQGTIFRAHEAFDASGDAFVGDWLAEGYVQLSAYVRHNAPLPLNYFARLATPSNFPAAGVVSFIPVLPNTWTELSFNVQPSSPQIVTYEGSDHQTIFSNIGNLQLFVEVPAGLESDPTLYRFDLDQVSVSVPEPATFFLLLAGSLTWLGIRNSH